jgi:hypothetical protein
MAELCFRDICQSTVSSSPRSPSMRRNIFYPALTVVVVVGLAAEVQRSKRFEGKHCSLLPFASSHQLISHPYHFSGYTEVPMPPSTTPATSQNHGQCVVCGKETSMGCGDCKRGGLTWMYFCSVDHQRLVSFSLCAIHYSVSKTTRQN